MLPIIARPPLTERNDVQAIHSMQIWSPAAGKMIPLDQVASGAEIDWEDPVVRLIATGVPDHHGPCRPWAWTPSQLFNRVRGEGGADPFAPGPFALNGAVNTRIAQDPRSALAKPLPMALTLMVLIVVCLFNSIRTTLVIWFTVPLCIIGVTAGLLLTGQPFGFMALLGVLSLGGEQIKNSIVVLDKVSSEISQGKGAPRLSWMAV